MKSASIGTVEDEALSAGGGRIDPKSLSLDRSDDDGTLDR